MTLFNTVILDGTPEEDGQVFQSLLAHLLGLVVIPGDGDGVQQLVAKADKVAGGPSIPFRVVWAKRPDDIMPIVAGLPNGGLAMGAIAFAINHQSKAVVGAIMPGESADFIDFMNLFQLAGGLG